MPDTERAGRRGAPPGILAVLAFALAAAVGPAVALASTAAVEKSTLRYEAASGEVNNVTSTLDDGLYTINDTGAAITAGAGCTPVDASWVTCPAAPITRVRIAGKNLNDTVLAGGIAPYTLAGGEGNDTLVSSDAGDELEGGDGNDFLDGGFGPDIYRGGDDADSFFTRDGFVDDVKCGDGLDVVEADLGDIVDTKDCEDIRRAAPTAGQPGAPGTPGTPGAPDRLGGTGAPDTRCRSVRISRRAVRLVGMRVGIQLTAPAAVTDRCKGVVRLDALLPFRGRAAARTSARIGSGKFSLRPGQRKTIRVRITRSGRRAIRRLRRVRTRVKAHVRRGAGASRIARRVITVRAPGRRR